MTTATNRNSLTATEPAPTVPFTSESVTEGHPDKIADQISDAILDEALRIDPLSRVACETLLTTGLVVIAGEITTTAVLDYTGIARRVVREIGYTGARFGFDFDTCAVITAIDRQSRDIKKGVDTGGAGDQGLMFGYACNETPELMPLPISLAHRLTERLAEVRKSGVLPYLGPDGKSHVTVEYDDDRRPVRVSAVVVSSQHEEGVEQAELHEGIRREVIAAVVSAELLDERTAIHINPTGSFVVGGPVGDTGLTGRKIIVDTYGGSGAHGGGAFSGKDPTKLAPTSYVARETGTREGVDLSKCYSGVRAGRFNPEQVSLSFTRERIFGIGSNVKQLVAAAKSGTGTWHSWDPKSAPVLSSGHWPALPAKSARICLMVFESALSVIVLWILPGSLAS